MTAYGRGSRNTEVGKAVAEITSVNRKFLEIQLRLPKELSRFEMELRKKISEKCSRGQVTLRLFVSFENISPVTVHPNIPLARQIFAAFTKVAEELQIPNLSNINLLDMILFEETSDKEEDIRSLLHGAVDQALTELGGMKEKEGKELSNDLTARLQTLSKEVEEIAVLAPSLRDKNEKRLRENLKDTFENLKEEDGDRILREVVLLAEKSDITEEIVRLRSHFTHFQEWLEKGGGKTLEFILQEMLREVNTIGSKCQDVSISKRVILLKAEVEKMREQVQNIE